MAEPGSDRSQQATARRKEEARRKGQVAISRDVPTAVILFGAVGLLYMFSGTLTSKMTTVMQDWLMRATDAAARSELRPDAIRDVWRMVGWDTLKLVLPVSIGVAVAGSAAYFLQIGWLWRPETLHADVSRVSPLAGLSRLLSFRSAAELIKALIKLAVIGGVVYLTIRRDLTRLPELVQYDPQTTLIMIAALVFRMIMLVAFAMGVIALVDYVYQRFEWERSLKMSRQEVKEEHRETEGDPTIRSRVRSLQRQMARHRMMADVPKADVIITNPTHLAVALRYDQNSMTAPIVVAKGAGFIAERIKEVAREHGVMVMENKIIARTLYELVDIGREVPAELYRAVAEILALVYRARGRHVG
jgi:flagellar biosynthetic protein FlhB